MRAAFWGHRFVNTFLFDLACDVRMILSPASNWCLAWPPAVFAQFGLTPTAPAESFCYVLGEVPRGSVVHAGWRRKRDAGDAGRSKMWSVRPENETRFMLHGVCWLYLEADIVYATVYIYIYISFFFYLHTHISILYLSICTYIFIYVFFIYVQI